MKTEIHYRWRVQDFRGRWYTTRWHTTEESIRIEHPEAKPVLETRIERQIPDTPLEIAVHELEKGTPPLNDGLRALHAKLRAELDAQRGQDSTSA